MKRKKSYRHNNYADRFNKIYEFKGNDKWKLPQSAFQDSKWQIPSLQAKKIQLNDVKEQLSCYDLPSWSWHTKKRDPSTQIIKVIRKRYNPELLTQAWCKFYECLSRFNLISRNAIDKQCFHSLHLCEAPGGFISALNHYLHIKYPQIKFVWQATTLNPHYEGNPTSRMIPDDRLIIFTESNWLFGLDHTGDLMKEYNYKWIIDTVTQRANGKVDLVTADGSINCMDDPGDQERHVENLHYCEVITALSVLNTDGHFVLKIFTSFEDSTISLLYLLNCVFISVYIMKPSTSKSGNSETYVICKYFKGIQKLSSIWNQLTKYYEMSKDNVCLFALSDINEEFLVQVEECSEYFMQKQINTINENIKYFGFDAPDYNNKLYRHNNEIANEFLNLYRIYPIEKYQHLASDKQIPICVKNTLKKYSNIAKCYTNKGKSIKLNLIYGKKLNKVLYSKFINLGNLPRNIKTMYNKYEKNSLFNLCKIQLSNVVQIIDCSEYFGIQHNMHHQLFKQLYSVLTNESNKNILLINLHLITNFIVGLIYVLSKRYTIIFFKYGLLYLSKNNEKEIGNLNEMELLLHIKTALSHVPKNIHGFEYDLLEIIKYSEYTNGYISCVYFYNNYYT